MADLKRDEIKYIRDISKSAYKKGNECFICGSHEEIQHHHYYSLTALWNVFKKKNKITINSVQDILDWREVFKSAHGTEIYEEVVDLCKSCHMGKLHKIYGKSPSLGTAQKQKRWAKIQREKRLNK